jgi:hypothetical protein
VGRVTVSTSVIHAVCTVYVQTYKTPEKTSTRPRRACICQYLPYSLLPEALLSVCIPPTHPDIVTSTTTTTAFNHRPMIHPRPFF